MSIIPGLHGLHYNSHGGECCGVSHLWGFPVCPLGATDDQRVAYIKQGVENILDDQETGEYDDDEEYIDRRNTHQHCIEVVITNNQTFEWRAPLETVGFKEVYSFKNSNTNNICRVFMYTTNEVKP